MRILFASLIFLSLASATALAAPPALSVTELEGSYQSMSALCTQGEASTVDNSVLTVKLRLEKAGEGEESLRAHVTTVGRLVGGSIERGGILSAEESLGANAIKVRLQLEGEEHLFTVNRLDDHLIFVEEVAQERLGCPVGATATTIYRRK